MEEDVYNKESRAEMVENDEMSPREAAFMEGAEGDGQKAKCRKCGNAFVDQDPIEKEIDGKVCWFCSDECLKEYEKEHE